VSTKVSGALASFLVAVCGLVPATVSGQERTFEFPLVYSTTPMTRDADLMLSASILSTAAVDGALAALSPSIFRGSRPSGRFARAFKLVFVDVPVVTYFRSLNHEWGHQTSGDEFDLRTQLSLVGTPWSAERFRLVRTAPMPEGDLVNAALQGGGLEASRRLKDRAEARMRRAARVAPGHALAAIFAAVDAPIYAWRDLPPSRFEGGLTGYGDVSNLVFDLARRRFGYDLDKLDDLRRHVRTRTTLNLVDAGLWSEAFGLLVDHVWNGEPSVRVRWLPVAGVRLLPSVRDEWSPYGPEYYVGTQFKTSQTTGAAYLRWTEHIGSDRQTGAGASMSFPSISTTIAGRDHLIVPTVDLDVWAHTTEGFGVHASIGADFDAWPWTRATLTVAAGAKSRGHLIGYALDPGPYVTAGVNVRVW
jgi:hypothetical protein